MTRKLKSLQAILDNTVDTKKVFGASFAVKKGSSAWLCSSGDIANDQSYFIASTTKLFTTAIILRLASAGKLGLEDSIDKYLEKLLLNGLHIYLGKDYSCDITIKDLLAHTSGLPDYFQNKGANGKSLVVEILKGNDQSWSFEQAMERTKAMKPLFAPGTKHKAHYSDSNFQLLGEIIARVTDKSYAEKCNDLIIQPLGLAQTYLYVDANDRTPKTLYHKDKELLVPKAMTSFGPDGGMVSTSADLLKFIEAFFSGQLFPVDYIKRLQSWNRIFFPMQSGVGIHRFKLPWLLNPTGAIPHFIGHSGLSGALAFFSPEEDLYVAGTVNQVAHPDISFKTMIKMAQVLRKK